MSSTPHTGIEPPKALTQRVHAAVRAQRTMMFRTHLRTALALLVATALSTAIIAAMSEVAFGRQALGLQVGVKSSSLLALVATTLLVLLIVSTGAALRRGRSGLGTSTSVLRATALSTAPLYAVVALLLPVHDSAATAGSLGISPWGARCLVIASSIGLIVLGCFAFAMRAAAPTSTRIRSVVLGSAAGAWAGLALFVFCPSGDALHLSIGHVLPVVALTLLGAISLPPTLRP